ncbi:MAG: hypothetical protein KTR14_01675 [Vampirovibrio sp.]|nr:hypothetical protein [Vampirovibrio sp.]
MSTIGSNLASLSVYPASFNLGSPFGGGVTGQRQQFATPAYQAAASPAATVPSPPPATNADLMASLLSLMTQMLQHFLSAFQSGSGALPGTQPPAPTGTALAQDDYLNYLLAQTQGGATGVNKRLDSRFSTPGSRFANATPDQFDAVVAQVYADQIKGYALGLPVAYSPGDDLNQIAGSIQQAANTPFTPEADLLSKVAATYLGDLGGNGNYDHQAMQNLLVQWGRADLAAKPGVGQFDVQSIGSVVQALNEEPDPATRQAWLGQIFSGFTGGPPTSPSGAVPDIQQYLNAINLVQGGALDQLLQGYAQA